jgi:hypothetical protein
MEVEYDDSPARAEQQQQQQQQQQPPPEGGVELFGAALSEEAQQIRRNSIRSIMADEGLTAVEKARSIQYLMDGRRRSSSGGSVCSGGSVGGGSTGVASRGGGSSGGQGFYYQNNSQDDDDGDDQMAHQGPPTEVHLAQSNNHDGSEVGDGNNSNDIPRSSFAARKQRSSSMPLWSDGGVNAVAPLAAASSNVWDDPRNVNRRMEKSRPHCEHYERNCTIISPCCGLAFGCRICHDDCPVLPMPIAKQSQQQDNVQLAWVGHVDGTNKQKHEKRRSMPLAFDEEETHHEIDRFAIAEVICRLCYVRQSSKT